MTFTNNRRSLKRRGANPETPAEKFRARVVEIFGKLNGEQSAHSLIVDKQAALQSGLADLPRFVVEFLIGAGMSKSKKGRVNLDLIRGKIAQFSVTNANQKQFKSRLMDETAAQLIGCVSIDPKPDKGQHIVNISQLGETKVYIDDDVRKALTKAHPALLGSSVWGSIGLGYRDRTVMLESFTPYQLTMHPKDMARFKEGRRHFDTLQWIDLLIMSMGYNPSALETRNLPMPGQQWKVGDKTVTLIEHPTWGVAYDTGEKNGKKPVMAPATYLSREDGKTKLPVWTLLTRFDEDQQAHVPVQREEAPVFFHAPDVCKKLLMLSRLLPLMVKNYHMVELGPRGTGKSYVLRNLSPRVYLIAGARTSAAQLISSMQRGAERVGILGQYQVAVFDEIGATKFPDLSLVAAMKDYMESNQLGRGGKSAMSDCSLIFAGNIDLAPSGKGPMYPDQSWFRVFPEGMRDDSAFFDRIAGAIPGWELPKISDDSITPDGVGFLADYFGEVLSQLRNDTTIEEAVSQDVLVEAVAADGTIIDATIRDRRSVHRSVTGMFKLLYPHGVTDPQIDTLVFDLAAGLRQNVHDQMVKLARGEFPKKTIRARFKPEDGRKVKA